MFQAVRLKNETKITKKNHDTCMAKMQQKFMTFQMSHFYRQRCQLTEGVFLSLRRPGENLHSANIVLLEKDQLYPKDL